MLSIAFWSEAGIGTGTRSAKMYRTSVVLSEITAPAFDSEGAFISNWATRILQEQNARQKETLAMLRPRAEREVEGNSIRASRTERETE